MKKVRIGELKTHLSKYLRDLEGSDEAIEVCVREDTVAYLRSAKAEARENPDSTRLKRKLKAAGLTVSQWGCPGEPLHSPGRCKAPAGGPNSIAKIRRERNY